MNIAATHLRQLLDAEPNAQLVVQNGRVRVVRPTQTRGQSLGLAVFSCADLRAELGDDEPTDELLTELARRINSAITSMGG